MSGKLFYVAEYREGTPAGNWKAFFEKDGKEFPDHLYSVLADALRKDGDMLGAIGFWDKAISINKEDYRLRAFRAECYIEIGKLETALHDLNFVVSKDRSTRNLIWRGHILYRMKAYGQAFKDADAAVKLDRNQGDAFALRGLVYVQLGDSKMACPDFKKAKLLNASDEFNIENI